MKLKIKRRVGRIKVCRENSEWYERDNIDFEFSVDYIKEKNYNLDI